MNRTYVVLIVAILAVILGILLLKKPEIERDTTVFEGKTVSNDSTSTANKIDKNTSLSAVQERALETLGIDPAKLPTKMTPELKSCFEAKIGRTRVEEIKAGSFPTMEEIIKGKACL